MSLFSSLDLTQVYNARSDWLTSYVVIDWLKYHKYACPIKCLELCSSESIYPLQDFAAQMSLRNRCMSSATLLAVAVVPNISVMSLS